MHICVKFIFWLSGVAGNSVAQLYRRRLRLKSFSGLPQRVAVRRSLARCGGRRRRTESSFSTRDRCGRLQRTTPSRDRSVKREIWLLIDARPMRTRRQSARRPARVWHSFSLIGISLERRMSNSRTLFSTWRSFSSGFKNLDRLRATLSQFFRVGQNTNTDEAGMTSSTRSCGISNLLINDCVRLRFCSSLERAERPAECSKPFFCFFL